MFKSLQSPVGIYHCQIHFLDEETEAQRGEVPFPRLSPGKWHSWNLKQVFQHLGT